MNKFVNKIHNDFVAGKIGGAIFSYMLKIASNTNEMDASILEEQIKKLTALNITTENDCQTYFNIYATLPKYAKQLIKTPILLQDICKYAFTNRNNYDFNKYHNYSKVILDFANDNIELMKKAYPNNAGIESTMDVDPPFDLNKWIETMRYIYEASNTNNLSLDNATDQVVVKWPDKERDHFKRWMKYYQEGNYNKYNVKTAQLFPFKQETAVPNVKDMFQPPSLPKPDPMAEKKQRLNDARNKLRSRLKSVEELLETYRDVLPVDVASIMRKDVFDLKEKILGLELKASLVDSVIRTSNQFNKYGFIEGANELKKIAQEVAEDKLPPLPATKEIAPAPELSSAPEPAGQKAEAPVRTDGSVPHVNVSEEAIEIPDFSSATHRDALQKLEEINKVISERNVVRALAAVDIILGQLGIASYFPQLSEAQSKLMDAFNYAGTRVAETIGQMRGGGGKGIPVDKQKQDVVEVADEVEKPVGEVVSGGPKQQAPVPKV